MNGSEDRVPTSANGSATRPSISERFAAEALKKGAASVASLAGTTPTAALVPEISFMASLVSAAVIVAALYFGREILIPLALAFLLGFVLDPLVGRLKRWGVPRVPAVALVVLFTMGALALAGFFLGRQVKSLSAELPTYQSTIMSKLRSVRESATEPGALDAVVKTIDAVKKEVEKSAVEPEQAARRSAAPAVPQRVRIEPVPRSPLEQVVHWLELASGPLAMAGIVLVFVVLVLLDRLDLRDRLLRLWGGNLHRSTDAMDEAGTRISKYLTMQLVVNLSYGVPMALGLWVIGVPGALLWGALAAIMRFVPYVGPMISAVFPLALAFAVDPGWSMVLWVAALIVTLELVSNNLVEPWLYGASTGLSAMSLMAAATFWTALWGPIGLIMSTPLTVCLLVIGRHLPRLSFLDVLLGSQPALDAPTRLYQRLLADEVEEAIELATEQAEKGRAAAFYNEIGLPVLRMATDAHDRVATVEHRHRLVVGMEALIDDLEEQHPSPTPDARPVVACVGGKWEVDYLAARMVAHALCLAGHPADHRAPPRAGGESGTALDLEGIQLVCLSFFSPEPRMQARHICRRLRRRWPGVKIVLGLWNAPAELVGEEASRAMGVDAVATSLDEALRCVSHLIGATGSERFELAPTPEQDAERVEALRRSGALDPRAQPLFDVASKRAADIFDVPFAMVSLIDEDRQRVRGMFGDLPQIEAAGEKAAEAEAEAEAEDTLDIRRELSVCGHVAANGQTLVVPDVMRDIRFAGNPVLRARGVRFYAGAPLCDAGGYVIGTLCVLDIAPRALVQREVRLLEVMAADLMDALRSSVLSWGDVAHLPAPQRAPPSATVAQPVPAGR